MDDINTCMNKVTFRNKKGYSNYNSFIVNFPRDEFLVDVAEFFFLKKMVNTIICFLCVDIFSKFASGIGMPHTNSNPTAII